MSRCVQYLRQADTYDVVDAQVAGTSSVRAREGIAVNTGPGEPVSMGIVLRAYERAGVVASPDRQSERRGDECQDGGSDDGRVDHL